MRYLLLCAALLALQTGPASAAEPASAEGPAAASQAVVLASG